MSRQYRTPRFDELTSTTRAFEPVGIRTSENTEVKLYQYQKYVASEPESRTMFV